MRRRIGNARAAFNAPPVPRVRRAPPPPPPPEPPACDVGACAREGLGLRSCRRWGRCCESPRLEGEDDGEWLRRTRPWVGEAERAEARFRAGLALEEPSHGVVRFFRGRKR